MDYLTEYLQVSRYRIIQLDIRIPTSENEVNGKQKSWFQEKHLRDLINLLKDVIWDRLQSLSAGDKQKGKKSRESNKSGKLTGKFVIIEYLFKLKTNRQSCIVPNPDKHGGDYVGCCLEKEKIVITVKKIPDVQPDEPVPSNSGYFRPVDKDGDGEPDAADAESRKRRLRNIVSKSGRQISKKSGSGRQRKTVSGDVENNDGSKREMSMQRRQEPTQKASGRSQTNRPRSNESDSSSDESCSGKEEDCSNSMEYLTVGNEYCSNSRERRLGLCASQSKSNESRSSECYSKSSHSITYGSEKSEDEERKPLKSNKTKQSEVGGSLEKGVKDHVGGVKRRVLPKKRKMRMADFVLHPEENRDDNHVRVRAEETSNDGAIGSELVDEETQPDLIRHVRSRKSKKKVTRDQNGEQESDFSDDETNAGVCSVNVSGHEEEEVDHGKILEDLSCSRRDESNNVNTRHGMNASEKIMEPNNRNVEEEQNDLHLHLDLDSSDNDSSRSVVDSLSNADLEPAVQSGMDAVNDVNDDSSMASNPFKKDRPDSKHGKSLLPVADGRSLSRRQAKKCSINPVPANLGNSGVMTAVKHGKVIEITKKNANSKVCLSYADSGQRIQSAPDESARDADDVNEIPMLNSNQGQVKKFCQNLKSKRRLLGGQSKPGPDQAPYILLDGDFWENDLNPEDSVSKDMSDTDSEGELPNMEAINSPTLSSCVENKSPLENSSKCIDDMPSSTTEVNLNAASDKMGKRRGNGATSKDLKAKKDKKAVKNTKRKADKSETSTADAKEEKRSRSKQRIGIFEKLSPARSGGFTGLAVNSADVGVQCDSLSENQDEEEIDMESLDLAERVFVDADLENEDVELKILSHGEDELDVHLRPITISPGLSDQRSTGAKSIAGEDSGGKGEEILAIDKESFEPISRRTRQEIGGKNDMDKTLQRTINYPSSFFRQNRFKGSYVEIDSDTATERSVEQSKVEEDQAHSDLAGLPRMEVCQQRDLNDGSDSDCSSVLQVVNSTCGEKRKPKQPRGNAEKSQSLDVMDSLNTQVTIGEDHQYLGRSSLSSRADQRADFTKAASREKRSSTSTCSSKLESYGFLATKSSFVDEDSRSSSSHEDWETFSVGGQPPEADDNIMLDSGFASPANTTVLSTHHADESLDLPSITPQNRPRKKLKPSPRKVKLKTVKETRERKATSKRKRLTKKASSPRSPRGLSKFQTSSLQTFSSSRLQQENGEELPDLVPSQDKQESGVSMEKDVIDSVKGGEISFSLAGMQKNKRRKVAKSVCQRKKRDGIESGSEHEDDAVGKRKKSPKKRMVTKVDGKISKATKQDKKSAAHLMMSSTDDETGRLGSALSRSQNSVSPAIDVPCPTEGSIVPVEGQVPAESDTVVEFKVENLSDSDTNSDAAMSTVTNFQNATFVIPKEEDTDDKDDVQQAVNQPVGRLNRQRKYRVLPSITDDDTESTGNGVKCGANLEEFTQGFKRKRSESTSSASSTELPNASSFVHQIRQRLSLCPDVNDDICVIVEELSAPPMVKLEDEAADQNETEIKALHDISELTASHLEYLVSKNEKYLREIFQGKRHCERHECYKRGGKDRQNLMYNIHCLRYKEEQADTVMESLVKIFCSRHQKYLDYVFKVMFPEMLIKIYMEVHGCSMEQAEIDLEDVQVDDIE